MTATSTPVGEHTNRESISPEHNPLGLSGIEFIEYATSKPQALGQVLEMMGWRPVARHRSREVFDNGTTSAVTRLVDWFRVGIRGTWTRNDVDGDDFEV